MGYDTTNLRNICLLGHSGSGKTTMVECMLFEANAIKRRGEVESKNTISDYTNIEQERGNSMFSSLMHAEWKDSKINLIDTPGFDDFVGEVISSLKVADTAVVLVNAANGVEVGTEIIWEHVEKNNTPTLFVINQIDHEKADFDTALDQLKARFGQKVVAVQYPLNQGSGFDTIVDTLRMTMYKFGPEGGKPEKLPIPESELGRAQEMHNALVEIGAENDEALMEKFFENGTLNEEELAEGLKAAMAQRAFYPVFIASAKHNMGSGRIMGFINDIAPSPADRRPAETKEGKSLECKADDPTTIFVYKTISEPQIGKVSYFKVYSGVLRSGDELVNMSNGTVERFNQIYTAKGKIREAVDELRAGDIGVTVKLKNTHTNQTLNSKGTEHKITPIQFPESRIRTAVKPPSKADMEKMAKAFHIIQEEDPTFIVEHSKELKQTILHGQGQLHLDLIKYRLKKVYNLDMEFIKPKIPYRETITKEANEIYRHKKQSGGAGQFAEVHMRIEPLKENMQDPHGLTVRNTIEEELPWGGKLSLYWCIVGGSIDSKYTNAIKKGLLIKMKEGPLTGSPCRDIRVSIYDGKMHPVDSNDMAFQIAAMQAFKNAFGQAGPKLMEPIYEIKILCGEENMGDIMGDLQSRRAIIQGMDTEGHYQKIIAHLPLAELHNYSSTLRSLTQGKAKFHLRFVAYAPVPFDIQKALEEAYRQESEEG